MKFTKVCVDRNQFAKRLGVESNQLAVVEVESSLDDVTITLVLDNDVELKSDIDASRLDFGGNNLRRFSLVEDVDGLKKQILDLQTQNLKLHQEIANLQQDLLKAKLGEYDEKRSHDTESTEELDMVSKALDEAEKVFNVIFNVSEPKGKTAKELVDEIANAMKNMGKWQ